MKVSDGGICEVPPGRAPSPWREALRFCAGFRAKRKGGFSAPRYLYRKRYKDVTYIRWLGLHPRSYSRYSPSVMVARSGMSPSHSTGKTSSKPSVLPVFS